MDSGSRRNDVGMMSQVPQLNDLLTVIHACLHEVINARVKAEICRACTA